MKKNSIKLKINYQKLDEKTIIEKYLGENYIFNLIQKSRLIDSYKDLITWNDLPEAKYYLVICYDLNSDPHGLSRILFYDLLPKHITNYGSTKGVVPTPFKKLKPDQLTYLMVYALNEKIYEKDFNKLIYCNDVEQYLKTLLIDSDGLMFLGRESIYDINNKNIVPLKKVKKHFHKLMNTHDFILNLQINQKDKEKDSKLKLSEKNINFFNGFQSSLSVTPEVNWLSVENAKSYLLIFSAKITINNPELIEIWSSGFNTQALVVSSKKNNFIKQKAITLPDNNIYKINTLNQPIDAFRMNIQNYAFVTVYATDFTPDQLNNKLHNTVTKFTSIYEQMNGHVLSVGALSFIIEQE